MRRATSAGRWSRPCIGDVRTLGIGTGDLAEHAVALGPQDGGRGQVAAAGLELTAVDRVARRVRTIGSSGPQGTWTQL